MNRIKTRQKSFYTGVDTPPPMFLPNRSKRNAQMTLVKAAILNATVLKKHLLI
ncbi:hypothetical protein AB4K20DRAFT_1902980 [Rhizopus microsporus]